MSDYPLVTQNGGFAYLGSVDGKYVLRQGSARSTKPGPCALPDGLLAGDRAIYLLRRRREFVRMVSHVRESCWVALTYLGRAT